MLNRPFSATNTNIFNEKTCSTTPANIFGQNVLLSQDQHRNVCDTLTTQFNTIPSSPPPPQMLQPLNTFNNCMGNCNYQYPSYPQQQLGFCQQPYQQQQTLPAWQCPQNPFQIQPTQNLYNYNCEDQLRLNQLQNRTAMELIQMQRQYQPCTPPYQLKFHIDNETSTADLFPSETKGRADLRNLASVLTTNWPYWLQNDPNNRIKPEHKKLTIRNAVEPLTTTIIDDIKQDEIEKYCKTKCHKLPGQRKVTFKSNDPNDAECQVHFCCHCCDHDKNYPAHPDASLSGEDEDESKGKAYRKSASSDRKARRNNTASTSSDDKVGKKSSSASADRKVKRKNAAGSVSEDRVSRKSGSADRKANRKNASSSSSSEDRVDRKSGSADDRKTNRKNASATSSFGEDRVDRKSGSAADDRKANRKHASASSSFGEDRVDRKSGSAADDRKANRKNASASSFGEDRVNRKSGSAADDRKAKDKSKRKSASSEERDYDRKARRKNAASASSSSSTTEESSSGGDTDTKQLRKDREQRRKLKMNRRAAESLSPSTSSNSSDSDDDDVNS